MSSTRKRVAWWYVDEHLADYVSSTHLALHEDSDAHQGQPYWRRYPADGDELSCAVEHSAERVSWKSAKLVLQNCLEGLIFFVEEPKLSVWAFKSPCDKPICRVESSMFATHGVRLWCTPGPALLTQQPADGDELPCAVEHSAEHVSWKSTNLVL